MFIGQVLRICITDFGHFFEQYGFNKSGFISAGFVFLGNWCQNKAHRFQ